MDPLREIPLERMPEVIRTAARMHGCDQARAERERLRAELVRAAAEIGLTEEYLRRAASRLRRQERRRARTKGFALMLAGVGLAGGLCGIRTTCQPAPPTAVAYVEAQPDPGWTYASPQEGGPQESPADLGDLPAEPLANSGANDDTPPPVLDPLLGQERAPGAEVTYRFRTMELRPDSPARGEIVRPPQVILEVAQPEVATGTGP